MNCFGSNFGLYPNYGDDYSYASYSSPSIPPFIISPLYGADFSDQSDLFPPMKIPFGSPTATHPIQSLDKDLTAPLPMDLSQKYSTHQYVYHPFCFPMGILNSLRSDDFSVTGVSGHSNSHSLLGLSFMNEKQQSKVLSNSFGRIDDDHQMEDKMEIQNDDNSQDYSIFAPQRASTPINFFNSPRLEPNPIEKTSKKRKHDDIGGTQDQENQPIKKKKLNKRKKKVVKDKPFCVFCKEKGEPPIIYFHHTLKDAKGRTLCPILRQIECKFCKTDGDYAHTIRDCPRRHMKDRRENAKVRVILREMKSFKI